ncbi:MAG TPA: GTPase domain-containing protein [Gemmataceae bacterium]|nr:GTPase domain-containing protein [Gemmataceae bacterium]
MEEHCRHQAGQGTLAGQLRLAAALVRNCIGPFLDGASAIPLHVAVVGGAGTGKSTVVNVLSGSAVAEANPQAGFTRHPMAYISSNGVLNWPAHAGFLGPLQRLSQAGPANLDEDVYQVRHIAPDPAGSGLLKDVILWDCPDMTTWAATGYVPRLLEVAGLADVLVYVASDERYNDEVPTQFLHLLLQTGKPVIVCLMKMQEADAGTLLAHFQCEVLGRLTRGPVASLAIPHLTPEQLADPARRAASYRIPLLNQIAVLTDAPAVARQRVVRGASHFLLATHDRLLAAARHDLAALESWRSLVQAGQVEFDNRYRREYLTSEKFRSFDEALVRLLELLELPGVGKIVSGTLWVVRTPYRLLKGVLGKALSRPEAPNRPELPVMQAALSGWLNLLHKEAVRRADSHPVWAYIEEGFTTGLVDLAGERFQQGFHNFQLSLADEVERTARAIYEALEKKPLVLNTLRSGNFALDVAAIAGAFTIGHFGVHDFVLVPLLASIKHVIVEQLGKQYVDNQREQIRMRQQLLLTQYVSGPLAEWLAQWPATGGTKLERLQLALRRIPAAAQQLDLAVSQAIPAASTNPSVVRSP